MKKLFCNWVEKHYLYLCRKLEALKKKADITLLVISVLIILIAPFIPHHHHDGLACAVMERCEQDNTYNDEHTDHATDNDGGSLCIEDATFLVAKSVSQADLSNAHLFPILISTINEILFGDIYSEIKIPDCRYIEIYKSVDLGSSNGLRAPPYSLI